MYAILFLTIFCGLYFIYCFYVNPKKIGYYCINKQCISIICYSKGSGVNSVKYARVYDGIILFRFQERNKSFSELLMEDDILISRYLLNNKFVVYGALPVIYGGVDNVEIREAESYIDKGNPNYILSGELKFSDIF